MSEEEVKLLTIQRSQRNDTGSYLCRVLNEYGFNDLIHHLLVLPGESIRISDIDFVHVTCAFIRSVGTAFAREEPFHAQTSLSIESPVRRMDRDHRVYYRPAQLSIHSVSRLPFS